MFRITDKLLEKLIFPPLYLTIFKIKKDSLINNKK